MGIDSASEPMVFVVDDDDSMRTALERLIRSSGAKVETFASARTFLDRKPPERPCCLVLDVKMPGLSGLEVQQALRERGHEIPIVFVTGHGDVPMSVRAMRSGAEDFLEKPFRDDVLLAAIRRGLERDRHARALRGGIKGFERHNFEEIVGKSDALMVTLRRIEQVAATDASVLLTGETGTGKNLVARAIHKRSARKARGLIEVDCTTLPAGLIESELFGHEKGAYTGALEAKPGRFEMADGGTILIDEVGELPLELQPKLLRVIEHGEFQRLGGRRPRRVDVRVIAATNRNLQQEMLAKRFRQDLFYRLSVFPIEVPPLRDRREDILLLATFFVCQQRKKLGKSVDRIPAPTMDALMSYDWPGNVRELQNVIERALILSRGRDLTLPEQLGLIPGVRHDEPKPLKLDLTKIERRRILDALESTSWTIKGEGNAASRLGLKPSTLRSRMKRLGIKRPAPAS